MKDNTMLQIITYPNPILRQKANPIKKIDDKIHKLIAEMAEVMYNGDGIGLAAPQVGISKQLIVVDIGEGLMPLINPKIEYKSDEVSTMEEGCLSLPDIRVEVTRPVRIRLTAKDPDGNLISKEADELWAIVFQHEIDHLNGILIIDHISSVQRALLKTKLKNLEKQT